MWTVIYSHGRDGDPWNGTKIQAMKPIILASGMNMVSIKYDETNTIQQMIDQTVQKCLSSEILPERIIFIGSSRGAYISAAASEYLFKKTQKKSSGLFMLSPAIGIKSDYYPNKFPEPQSHLVEIVHGYEDDIIPYQSVVEFCAEQKYTIHLVEDDHRLHNQKEFICNQLERFLMEIKKRDI